MAGKAFTIIELQKAVEYRERFIAQALNTVRPKSDVNVQPIDGEHAYLIFNNKRIANAEAELNTVMAEYKKLGGKEFSENILSDQSIQPTFAGLTDDKVVFVPSPPSTIDLNSYEWCMEHGVAPPASL